MSDPFIWSTLAAVLVAMYFAALYLSLLQYSRSRLEQKLAERGRKHHADWLEFNHANAVLAVSFVRTLARIAAVICIVVSIVGIGEAAIMTWPRILLAGALAMVLLWIFSSVVAGALAQYAAVGMIAASLHLIRVITILILPVSKLTWVIDEAIRRLTGANLRVDDQAEADLLRSIEDTQRQGALDEVAAEMLENVVEFSTTDVGEIMTPRTDIEGIQMTDDLTVIRDFIAKAGHSRIPVYEESLDQIKGILYAKDLIPFLGEDTSDFTLDSILRPPLIVPDSKSVRDLLTDFQKNEVHLGIVIDEYGGTAGLVTIEDVLEEIVGEIHDEHEPEDEEEPTLTPIDDNLAQVDGRYHIDDLNEEFDLDLPEDEEFDTVGGFMMAKLGRVPDNGETVEVQTARLTAVETTPTHVVRIEVERIPASRNGENPMTNGK